jgi:hypothetical protein
MVVYSARPIKMGEGMTELHHARVTASSLSRKAHSSG